MNNEGNNNNGYMSVWLLLAVLSGFLWLLLIILKVTGVVSLHWILVLTGGFWIPFLLLAIAVALAAVLIVAAKAKRWHRRRKVNRRIIRQAKAAGIWTPEAAGGRALELLAKEYELRREPEETDTELRNRILLHKDITDHMRKTSERLEKRLKEPPELCTKCWNEGCRNNEALRVSKVETCLLFKEGLMQEDAGAYVKEDE